MRWNRLTAICVVSLASVALTTTAAHADAPLVGRVPLVLSASAQTDIKRCVGENVTVTQGEFNRIFAPDVYMSHRNIIDGLAVGNLTGDVYRVSGHRQVVDHLIGADGEVYTFVLRLSVASDHASFLAQGHLHLTYTPTGDLASYSDTLAITCG